jgi:hypothetical protein
MAATASTTASTTATKSRRDKDTDPKRITYEKLTAGVLDVDHRVQRDHVNESKLNKIRAKYNRPALGTLVVSRREDGTKVLLDGQHRWLVVKELEGETAELDCRVHHGLTLQEEAELFVYYNVQEAASPLDLHKARVTQGEKVALDIDKAARDNGWVIGAGHGRISAIKVLEDLYLQAENEFTEYGPQLVSDTIAVVTQAWGVDEPHAASANILKAVGKFLLSVEVYITETGRPSSFFDRSRLALAMQSKFKGGAKGWISAQRGIAQGSEMTLGQAMLESLYQAYNKMGRSGKLPDIWG